MTVARVVPGRSSPGGSYARLTDDVRTRGKPAQRLQDDGEHTHTLAVDYSSLQTAPSAGSVLPAWFALCYVMLLDPARA